MEAVKAQGVLTQSGVPRGLPHIICGEWDQSVLLGLVPVQPLRQDDVQLQWIPRARRRGGAKSLLGIGDALRRPE